MTVLKLFLLGPPRVEIDGAPVDLQRRKAVALLAYLALTTQPHSRDALATLFWPDLDQQRGRAYLRRDLAVLNNSLPGNWFIADREIIELRSDPAFWLDVAHFRGLLAACRSHDHSPEAVCADCLPLLAQAAELYTNDFLAGFTLPDSAGFDDWQFFQSEGLRQELAWLLERLVRGLSAHDQAGAAVAYARRWVALDPLHEPAQWRLIWLYDQAGQPSAALRQYEEYARLLEEELGLSPEEETTTLVEAIRAKRRLKPFLKTEESAPLPVQPPDLQPARRPASSGLAAPRHNLPAQPTLFIGREKELAEIKQLLLGEAACRLLTLAGPGGIGKTRLAVASAAAILYAFPQGTYFVSLASVGQPEFIVPAIAEAIGFIFSGTAEPRDQLLTYLSEQSLLLLLDNFEHLLAGADLLPDILHAAPNVTLLVTSRERLNLQEEWSYEVEGMTFPQELEESAAGDLASLEKYSATRLFLQRARQAQANFTLSAGDIPYVVRICELVNGMPLGLELAAPWVRLMPCREIAAEIERNLDFLSTSLHNLPPRHRSVRAVFEQTWERLPEEERAVLRRLSIFRGGCQRQAAEEITGATLPRLLALVDKALLRRTENGRYTQHELIRQFSLEQLQAHAADYEQIRDRHCAWYTTFLHRQTGAIKGGGQAQALDAITAEIDNIRAAWQWAIERKDALALAQAAECYCLYSEMRGALHEGETAFQQAVAAFAADPAGDAVPEHNPVRGLLMAGQGMLAAHRGSLQQGQELLEQGLALLQQAQDTGRYGPERAFALLWLGWTLFLQGKNVEAEEIIPQGLALFSDTGDRWGLARSLFVLGNSLTARGRLAEAEPPLRESLAICKDIDDRRSLLLVNRNLAILTLWFGDYAQTRELLDEAALLSREIGDQIGLAYTLRELGVLEVALGQYAQAIQTVRQSITITDTIGSRWESAVALDDLGQALRLSGDYTAAEWAFKRCLEAARAIHNRYYTARCLGDLGCLAYHQAEYTQAGQLLHEALELWTDMGHEPYSAWVLSQLGHVAAAAGDQRQAEARQYYLRALQLSLKHKLAPFALEIFVGLARHLARGGDMDILPRLLSLAEQHPASHYETRQNARGLLADLAAAGRDITPGPAAGWPAVAEEVVAGLGK